MTREEQIARDILQACGGAGNVASASACMTRLRLEARDPGRVDQAALKRVDGVKGVVQMGAVTQVIFGPGLAEKVTDAVVRVAASGSVPSDARAATVATPAASGEPKGRTQEFLRQIASVFLPLLPAIIGSGMIAALTNLLVRFGVSDKLPVMQALNLIGFAVFGYLSVMVGMNAAKVYGGPPAIGAVAGAILISPALSNLKMVPGRGGLIGALLAAAFLSWLYRQIGRRMPDALSVIFTPTLTVLIGGFVILYVVQPVGGAIANAITAGAQGLLRVGGPMAGAVLAGFFLPLVMTGLHHGLVPIHLELIKQLGNTPLLPILAMAGAGQVGASIAVYLKTRDRDLKRIVLSALPIGMLGIGEPLIFGVTLPLGKPFVTACIGGAVGGAFIAMTGIGTIAMGVSGLPLAFLATGPGLYLTGILISYVAGFAVTYLVGFDDRLAASSRTFEMN